MLQWSPLIWALTPKGVIFLTCLMGISPEKSNLSRKMQPIYKILKGSKTERTSSLSDKSGWCQINGCRSTWKNLESGTFLITLRYTCKECAGWQNWEKWGKIWPYRTFLFWEIREKNIFRICYVKWFTWIILSNLYTDHMKQKLLS